MFAKFKITGGVAGSVFGKTPAKAGPDFKARLEPVITALKKPYVAPSLALVVFLALGATFIALSSDPDAGSPSIRVKMPKETVTAATASPEAPPVPSGADAFTIDSLGLFSDAPVGVLDANGQPVDNRAVITLPGSEGATSAPRQSAQPLPPAPIAGLSQPSPQGPQPVIGPNGQTPASAYARPFRSDGRPMVALIVGGLGINPATTKAAIEQLPAEVTLSFVPYADNLQTWIDLARAQGHEVLIEVPMQPVNYPDNDTGPDTLLVNARTDDLNLRLNKVLGRATGYFGITNYQGSAFLKDRAGIGALTNSLKARGLAFIDDGQARGLDAGAGAAMPRASADRVIDQALSAAAIQTQLTGLESTAKSRGQALGTGFAYPVTVSTAIKWTQTLNQKGLQLAPA
ncbi:MAG: hypothetical protein B7Z26_07785, partial [Asticcacaulis sp. 32-58-5]